ncbi:MAG: ribosome-associated translation inhibitor RaiA [Candidatus Methylomirabilis sp.]|nr:ribosome-associated translation inhibitor RaiA [Deltaproteobacteria bacterium]
MDVTVTFRHLEATEAIKGYAEDKARKLEKLVSKGNKIHFIFEVDHERQSAEIHLTGKDLDLAAKAIDGDMYAAIDGAVDKMSHELKKAKGKSLARRRKEATTATTEE